MLYVCNMAGIGLVALEEMSSENVDRGQTKDACLFYKLWGTYEHLAQVS